MKFRSRLTNVPFEAIHSRSPQYRNRASKSKFVPNYPLLRYFKSVIENKVRSSFTNDDGGVFFTEKSISDYCSYGLQEVQLSSQQHANFDLNTQSSNVHRYLQLTFISIYFCNFPTSGSGAISGFPETTYFSGVDPAKFENLFFGPIHLQQTICEEKFGKNSFSALIFDFLLKTGTQENSGFSIFQLIDVNMIIFPNFSSQIVTYWIYFQPSANCARYFFQIVLAKRGHM